MALSACYATVTVHPLGLKSNQEGPADNKRPS